MALRKKIKKFKVPIVKYSSFFAYAIIVDNSFGNDSLVKLNPFK
jgi:hypothetical protein